MNNRARSRLSATGLLLTMTTFSGCSLDPVPVHPARVRVAQEGAEHVATGPGAPGYQKLIWSFPSASGYSFDPAKIEISGGRARLKARKSSVFKYPVDKAVIETSSGKPYALLDSFIHFQGPAGGEIRYQLSPDGAKWFYSDGKQWKPAVTHITQANLAQEINARIGAFHVEAGAGALHLRMFLVSPTGSEPAELQRVEVGSIAPRMD